MLFKLNFYYLINFFIIKDMNNYIKTNRDKFIHYY